MTIAATGAIQPGVDTGLKAKRERTIYWVTTGIVCVVMVYSIINFTFLDHFPFPEGGFVHLGLPSYFRTELTIAKALGVLALLVPGVPAKIKEFAYFGFGITLVSAAIAHFSRGDARISILFVLDPLIFFVLLTVSYFYFTARGGGAARSAARDSGRLGRDQAERAERFVGQGLGRGEPTRSALRSTP